MVEFNSSDLLVQGDIATAITRALLDAALGDKASFEKAGTATLISIVSRLLSKSFPDSSKLNGAIKEDETSNMFVVGVVNALVAWGMKRNIAKQVALGVVADVSGDRMLTMLDFSPNKSIFGSKDDKKDAAAAAAAATATADPQ